MYEMDDVVRSLKQEYRIILLLNHRNKNQHRAAGWYEAFNEMKRNCGQIVDLLGSRRLQSKRLRDTEWVKLYKLLQRALFRQLKKWYWQFNGIIALGQLDVYKRQVLLQILSHEHQSIKSMTSCTSQTYNHVKVKQWKNKVMIFSLNLLIFCAPIRYLVITFYHHRY